jgi:sterol desaturase/sphingolipid hydroxylase (fatty acid hydroxylase superfamily)
VTRRRFDLGRRVLHPSALLIELLRLVVWLAMLLVVFVPLERALAVRRQRVFRDGFATDLALYFLNSLLPAMLLTLPMALLALVARHLLPAWWLPAVGGLPLWLRMALAFGIGEIGFYWGHRWSHEWRWMWRFHRVHHTPEALDWLINTRAHPFDIIFTRLCGLVPLYMIGLAAPSPDGSTPALLVIVIGTFWGFFIHANIRVRLGQLEHLIATPRFHHWHHVRSGPINRNYAAMLPLLDRLFATLHLPRRDWPEIYGVDPAAETPALQALAHQQAAASHRQ